MNSNHKAIAVLCILGVFVWAVVALFVTPVFNLTYANELCAHKVTFAPGECHDHVGWFTCTQDDKLVATAAFTYNGTYEYCHITDFDSITGNTEIVYSYSTTYYTEVVEGE